MLDRSEHDLERVPKVLAIDDCTLVHGLLKHHLRLEGVDLHIASTAREGVAMAERIGPDVILLDIELESGNDSTNGFEVLASIKESSTTSESAVIFLSASESTADRVRALDLGAVDFIKKPFDAAELCARVRSAVRLRRMMRMLAQKASLDGLTGLWNRAHFDRRLAEEVSESRRYGRPLTLVLADIDHFKRINDRFGHPVGDAVISRFASILATGRASDIPCRYGGEEFIAYLPNCDLEASLDGAEKVREAIEGFAFEYKGNRPKVTISIGVAVYPFDAKDVDELVRKADEALYRAKAAGRDRVYCLAGDTPPRRIA